MRSRYRPPAWRAGSQPPWAAKGEWGPGSHMVRRLFAFLFFLVLGGTLLGAIIATGFASLTGPNRWVVVGITLAALVGFGFTARWMFRRTWQPVGELIDATRRLGEGETGVRVRSRGRGPLFAVNDSFNRMAEGIEAEDERRRRLLADLSHEMRTPLTVVRGEIEAVLDGLHPPEQLSNVIDEVDLMDRLLDDLRVLALTEAGRLQLNTEPCDLQQIIDDVLASFASSIETHQIEVDLDGEDLPEVRADPHRIHQVLTNLISNAIQQMSEGGTLGIKAEANSNQAIISVTDTGPGISPSRLEHIFERFVKGGDSAGTGLGLSIARDLVEAHGGTISAANRSGAGAELVVRLPLNT